MLRGLVISFFVLLVLVARSGDTGPVRSALTALGWRRPDRVALLTVATHASRVHDTSDTESEYGSSKTAFSYSLSVDNKARYCALHQYDLNVDVHVDGSEADLAGGAEPRSSRFRKLALIRQLWESYDWIIWMDIDAFFIDPVLFLLKVYPTTAVVSMLAVHTQCI